MTAATLVAAVIKVVGASTHFCVLLPNVYGAASLAHKPTFLDFTLSQTSIPVPLFAFTVTV
jgi:hypothetical protein